VKQSNKSIGMDRVEGGINVSVSDSAEKYLDTLFEEIIKNRISAAQEPVAQAATKSGVC